jgi:CheY-like chemotaxis protein
MQKETPYILLAEDDPDDQDAFCEAWGRLNPDVSVKTVSDGKELFEYLDICPEYALPALILIDFKMPLVSGPEALQKLAFHPSHSRIPKLVWSSSERSKDIEVCKKLGARNYFKKPATLGEMDEMVHQISQIFIAEFNQRKTG